MVEGPPTSQDDEGSHSSVSKRHSPGPDRPDGIRTIVDTVVAAGQMLASPRKCRIWHEAWLHDGLPIQELSEKTSIPQSTVYELTREMVSEGSLYSAGTTDNNAAILKPTPMQIFVSEHPENIGHQLNIHSTLIGVVGRGVESDDIETFLDRNNYTLLLEAITGVLTILSQNDPDATNLGEYYGWIDDVDAHLIQGHIAAVLKRESEKPSINWEFPDDPVIEPFE